MQSAAFQKEFDIRSLYPQASEAITAFVATDRCYAADAGSPAGPRGGPAGQRDRVAPGARSGPGGAGAPCPVIVCWCPAPRDTGKVTWGRRAMRLGQSSGVSGAVRRFTLFGVEKDAIYSGTKSSGVR